jgi:hypothetical protein
VRQLVGTVRAEGECMMACGACVPCAQGGVQQRPCRHIQSMTLYGPWTECCHVIGSDDMGQAFCAPAAHTGDLICQRRSERMRKVALKGAKGAEA